jgi:hypothetical protein
VTEPATPEPVTPEPVVAAEAQEPDRLMLHMPVDVRSASLVVLAVLEIAARGSGRSRPV